MSDNGIAWNNATYKVVAEITAGDPAITMRCWVDDDPTSGTQFWAISGGEGMNHTMELFADGNGAFEAFQELTGMDLNLNL